MHVYWCTRLSNLWGKQLDYPNNFNIPAFPAGKTIALSRRVAIWISIMFFLIVAACAFLLLGRHFKTNYPFLISVDSFTDEWVVVAYPKEEKTMSQYEYIQEKLVNDFFITWFTISDNAQVNEARWQECSAEECVNAEQFNPMNITCAISCKSDVAVYREFVEKVLPDYRAMIEMKNETWTVQHKTTITKIMASENAGKWQVDAVINSKVMGDFRVFMFIDVAREENRYPATFGYYIKQFNAYRISQ